MVPDLDPSVPEPEMGHVAMIQHSEWLDSNNKIELAVERNLTYFINFFERSCTNNAIVTGSFAKVLFFFKFFGNGQYRFL